MGKNHKIVVFLPVKDGNTCQCIRLNMIWNYFCALPIRMYIYLSNRETNW